MKKLSSINNFTSTSLAQFFGLISQLIIIKVLTSHLSLAEFGLYSLILVVPALILPLVFSEVISGFVRYFFEEDKHALYAHALFYLIGSFALLLILLYPLKVILLTVLHHYEIYISATIFILALTNHFLIYLNSLNSTFFKLNYQSLQIIFHSLLLNIPKVILLIYLINTLDNKLLAVFFSLTAGHFLAFVITSLPILFKTKIKPQIGLLKKILSYSFWLIPASYFGTIINSSDRILIKALSSLENVGIYSIGYKVGDLIRQFFIVSFGSVLTPVKFNHKMGSTEYEQKMNSLFIIFCFVGLVLSLAINSIANPLILIIANESFLAANYVISFILLAHIIWGVNDFFNTGYLLQDQSRITSLILIVGAFVNVALNLILIPRWGLVGACAATALSYLAALPMSYYFAKKHHSLRFNLSFPLQALFLYCLVASTQTFLNNSSLNYFLILVLNLSLLTFFATILVSRLSKPQREYLLGLGQKLLKKRPTKNS